MVLHQSVAAVPEVTSIEAICLDDVQRPVVRQAFEYWKKQRGMSRFPGRDRIHTRDIAGMLPNMVLAKVLNGGEDFLLKIVGDDVGRSYRAPLSNRLMSEIAVDLPNTAEWWTAIYHSVAQTGLPAAARVVVGLDAAEIAFTQAEIVCLPLGATDDCADHLMIFAEQTA